MDFESDYEMTIDGGGVPSNRTFDVFNPATGQVFAEAPDCSEEQLDAAIESCRQAFPAWRDTPIEKRAE